jgi:hypothetical protein
VEIRIREARDFDILSSYPKSWRPDTCECTSGSRGAVRYRKDFQMTGFRLQSFRWPCQIVLALVFVFAFVPFSQSAAQPAAVIPQLLLGLPSVGDASGSIVVTGTGFTAGGDVFIGLYDQWGTQLYDPRWVVASQAVSGANGSADPANGYVRGGVISASFFIACQTGVMVRAHDGTTGVWTDVLDVDIVQSGCIDPRDDRRTPD